MSIENNNKDNKDISKNKIIRLKQSEALKQNGLVIDSVYYTNTNDVKISLNHAVNADIIFTIDKKKWQNNFNTIVEQAEEYGIYNKELKQLLIRHLNDNHEEILTAAAFSNTTNNYDSDSNSNGDIGSSSDDKDKPKREFVTYKYSQMGKGSLHEAVIVNGLPFFIRYNNNDVTNTFELIEKIEENSRILRPPNIEEYPYTPYQFESNDELALFLAKAKQVTLDELYNKSKSIFLKYVDQDKYIINLLAADSIWTYFQDLFSVTHYLEGVGDNDVGKSTIGYTFEYTGYRVIKGTAISGANYYRSLGTDEPGQCTIIEDEGDSISEDPDKIKILKSGYEYNGKVPKINMNSRNQEQRWFKTYGYKMILAERSLSQLKAKGLLDRTFSFHCRPGKVKYSIKEVVSENINKNPNLQKLYNELLCFRKLMLCYRLVHYKRHDFLPEIKTGLKNRDEELCKPLLQLFYGKEQLNEIIKTLEVFIRQRRDRRSSSLEAAIFPIIKQMLIDSDHVNQLDQVQNKELKYADIWNKIINGAIEGFYNDKKQNQYETVSYGILYNNYLSRSIANKFGAHLDSKRNGSTLTFNIEKLDLFENIYGESAADNEVKIKVEVETTNEEGDSDGSEENNNGYN